MMAVNDVRRLVVKKFSDINVQLKGTPLWRQFHSHRAYSEAPCQQEITELLQLILLIQNH
jgi:hypothetical protein